MTFTFVTNPFDDIARVRWAIGDFDELAYAFEDELIEGLITENGSWQSAAVAAVKGLITQLLMPNFQADWLRVDADKAVKNYEALLRRLQDEYQIEAISITMTYPTRNDGNDTQVTDYT